MNRLKLNYWVDMGMGIFFAITIVSLASRETMGLHGLAGGIFSILVVVHFILHAKTFKTMRANVKNKGY